jgi:Rrf2 family iron-sulfur cluster assembly transcriptional regulator
VKLTTKGRYAVMAMADLARYSTGRPVALADIAERQEISLSYLEQLFAKLRRGGLVKSVRGPGGGYLLARSSAETRISDAILAVDEPIRATRCTPGSPTGCRTNKSRCLTHDLWEELGNQIHLYLSSVSLEDRCNRRVLGTSHVIQHDQTGTPAVSNGASEPPVGSAPPTPHPAAAQ